MNKFFTLIPSLLLAIAIFAVAQDAQAGNLSGYAWSSNIGWVSMSCDNHGGCGASNYGVNVTPSGIMEGYAWSPFIGWITFNQSELGGCPTGTCQANFTKATGAVSGWMRACAVFANGCSGALKPTSLRGAWEGWIHLRGGSGPTAYGVQASGQVWGGYAWGSGSDINLTDAVIGWLSFSGPGYSVKGTGDAESEVVEVSCGATPGATGRNKPVSWNAATFGVTVSNYEWTFNNGDVSSPNPETVIVPTVSKTYSLPGTKSTNIVINPGATEIDGGVCTGAVVNGIDPGFPNVQIGAYDLEGIAPSGLGPMPEAESYVLQGSIFGRNIFPFPPALTVPFTSNFDIALDAQVGGACPAATVPGISLQTTPINSINHRQSKPVISTWVSALYGSTGNHCIRLCADDQNVVHEFNLLGVSREANACSSWQAFSVTKKPPPPVTGSCVVEPSLIKEKGSATWTVTAGGGDGTYSYVWSGTDGLSGIGSSVTKQYDVFGTKTASVVITSPGAPNSPYTVTCEGNLRVQRFEEF